MLMPLDIPPGIARQATPQASQGRWWDGNWVRWQGGVLRPIGGWERLLACELDELPLAMLAWRDNDEIRRLALGGKTKLLMYDGSLTDITPAGLPPLSDPGALTGYGTGLYGAELYGRARTVSSVLTLGQVDPGDWWSLDNFGEDLLALSTSDGILVRWSPGDPQAVAIAGAPVGGSAVVVTAERHVVVCGTAADPRTISWSDQEDPDTWTPTITNLAGSLQLQTASRVIAAGRVREGVLILTETDAHLLRWVGPPYAYGLERLAGGCGPLGPHTLAANGQLAVWVGAHDFWQWSGSVQPLPSPLRDTLFSDINVQWSPRSFVALFDVSGEVWFFWPGAASVLPSRYISYNWSEGTWSMGRMVRTAAAHGGVWGLPLLSDDNFHVQQHERGWTADGAPRLDSIWAETSDLQSGAGDRLLNFRRMLHDVAEAQERIRFVFTLQNTPAGPERVRGPYQAKLGGAKLDLKLSARSIRMRVQAALDGPWALGRMRVDANAGPGR